MHCYICVTYLMIICSAYPPKDRELSIKHEKRSLFHDVIESLRIRSQLPDAINHSDENNLAQSYDRYGSDYDRFDEPLQMPSDTDFIPRRNDRIEMPSLKYRFPKSLATNKSYNENEEKEEIVLYIDTPTEPNETTPSTQKPKKQKRPRPNKNKNKNEETVTESTEDVRPMTNNMAGQSQIGNRESQTVVKPTVIVNFRGTISHRESDIRLERRNDNNTRPDAPQNVFNINQEIKLDRAIDKDETNVNKIKQDVKGAIGKEPRLEEDMIMCESNAWKDKNSRDGRKYDNVLQILLTI